MKNRTDRGFALMLMIVLMLIFAVISYAFFFLIEQSVRAVKVKEVRKMRSYYVALAGLRYANMLTLRPQLLGFTALGAPGDPAEPETYTVTGRELGGNLFPELGVNAADITVTITEIKSGPNQGKYTATVRCRK